MRRIFAVLGAVALAAALSYPVSAGKGNNIFVFERDLSGHASGASIALVVEQQGGPECSPPYADGVPSTCVVNPFQDERCVWDVDDQYGWSANGILAAGESQSFSQCVIADDLHRVLGGIVYSKLPDLIVTINVQPFDATFTLTARPSETYDRLFEYRGCIVGPIVQSYYPDVVQVSGSNGGWGIFSPVIVTVTNPTDRTSRITSAHFEAGSTAPGAYRQTLCYGEQTDLFVFDGAVWRTAL